MALGAEARALRWDVTPVHGRRSVPPRLSLG